MVRIFAKIVADHPQTAYGGYCMVIQAEIWYVHHVVADTATFFVLGENKIVISSPRPWDPSFLNGPVYRPVIVVHVYQDYGQWSVHRRYCD